MVLSFFRHRAPSGFTAERWVEAFRPVTTPLFRSFQAGLNFLEKLFYVPFEVTVFFDQSGDGLAVGQKILPDCPVLSFCFRHAIVLLILEV
jgi:hypothetical protein